MENRSIEVDTGDGIIVVVTPNITGTPPGKLSEIELRFSSGPFKGLCWVGLAVWQSREQANRLNVTVPTRQFMAGGEKRKYNLLRIDHAQAEGEPNEVYYAPLNALQRRVIKAYESAANGPAQGESAGEGDGDSIPF